MTTNTIPANGTKRAVRYWAERTRASMRDGQRAIADGNHELARELALQCSAEASEYSAAVDALVAATAATAAQPAAPAVDLTAYAFADGAPVVPVYVAGTSRVVHAGRTNGTYPSGATRYRKACSTSRTDNHEPSPLDASTPITCKRCLAKLASARS
jgi:hypothetical protein